MGPDEIGVNAIDRFTSVNLFEKADLVMSFLLRPARIILTMYSMSIILDMSTTIMQTTTTACGQPIKFGT